MPGPIGIRPQSGPIHKRIHSFYQGEFFCMDTQACFPDGTVATPDNSRLIFTVVDDRYCQDEPNTFYVAEWNDNIEQIPDSEAGVKVCIPQSVTCTFRRGTFKYSLTLTDKLGQQKKVLEDGNLIVEYSADAPLPDAKYRDGMNTQNHTLGELE
jgi:hypothetical protein